MLDTGIPLLCFLSSYSFLVTRFAMSNTKKLDSTFSGRQERTHDSLTTSCNPLSFPLYFAITSLASFQRPSFR